MGERERVQPIYSTRADDPSLVDAIESFAVGVAERIDHLQDAERQGDLTGLGTLARVLAEDADAVGYESFAGAARALEAASHADKPDDARAQLLALTTLAQRVRLGHPGAF